MCQAFSCLITKSKKVYWKTGVDSHDQLQDLFVKKDKELKDDKLPPNNTFARIEITSQDNNYLNLKQKWIYKIDEKVKPTWLDKSYEKPCRLAFKDWEKEIYSSFNYKEARNPIHPFKIKAKVEKIDIENLKTWDSVRDSVRDSVWDSVWGSVGFSVGDSVRDSVRDSVGNSVGDSVWAYIGSLFPNIKKWKYVDYRKSPFNKIKGYPFQSGVDLWKRGLVPVYYNNAWRLYGSPNGNGKVKELYKEV